MKILSNSDFKQFINNITASKDEVERIISSHNNVREIIQSDELNGMIEKYLLVGSYKRGTNTKTLVDSGKKIDVDLAVIFKNNSYAYPYMILDKLYNLLDANYNYKGKVRRQSRSIGIELSKTHIDIVPFMQCTDYSLKPLYISKKNKNEWEKTNPICHIDYFIQVRKDKHNFIDYVKALKWWKKINKPNNRSYPSGIAIETLVDINYDSDKNLFAGFLKTLNNITKSNLKLLTDPCLSTNDLLISIKDEDYSHFLNKLTQSVSKMYNALETEDVDVIRKELGDQFPKCIIYNDDDVQKLTEKTYDSRNYSKKKWS